MLSLLKLDIKDWFGKSTPFIIVILGSLLQSCALNDNVPQVKEISLLPYKQEWKQYDSLPLNTVRAISASGNSVFLADKTNKRIIKLDSELNLIKTLSKGGKGPCEILSPIRMVIGENELYVYDFANKRFNIYSTEKGTCENHSFIGRLTTSFDFYDSSLILPIVSKENSMIFYNPNNGDKRPFGLLKEPPINSNKFLYNSRHVVVNSKGLIFALPEGIPVIEVYNQEGKLLKEHSISDIPPISSRIEFAKAKSLSSEHNPNSIYVLYGFVAKKNDYLFLLATDHLQNNEVENNTILIFDIRNETPVWEGWYRLNPEAKMDTWYSAFEIIDGRLLAYEKISSEFHWFKLNNF